MKKENRRSEQVRAMSIIANLVLSIWIILLVVAYVFRIIQIENSVERVIQLAEFSIVAFSFIVGNVGVVR